VRLDSIHLEKFRCFHDLTLNFDEKLTVIVAVNGAGKTTILDAVRIALWPYATSFDLANNGFNDPANTITIDDVTKAMVSEDGEARLLPSRISVTGEVFDVTHWSRIREKESPRSKTLDDPETRRVRQQAKATQERVRTQESTMIELPILGYYGTGRLWSNKKEKKKVATKTEIDNSLIRTYGYMDCLDPASSYRAFEKWFIKTLNGHTAEIGKIIKRDGALSLNYETKFSDRIAVIRNALDTVLESTDYQEVDLDIETQSLSMHNHKAGIDLKVDQLSDGVRNMVGMVADIAYRCYQLNPHLGARAALEAKGIVMIDEVDMHLHPSWQQLVIGQLQEAFPNIQFIVTTHSPQVLSTVPNECIRVLHEVTDEDGQRRMTATTPTEQTRGSASHEVLACVMDTHARPDLPETQQLTEYKSLIQQDLYRSEQALVLRQQLDTHFGSTHHLIKECERLIRLVEFKRGLPQRGGSNA
jgi:predicted ATP-binding protein involved in virulence